MRFRFFAAIFAAALLAVPAHAESTVPSPALQEVLIKTYLLSLNDANITGNYTVLHAKLAKPFRDQFTPDKLKEAFKGFADQKINFGPIVAKPPVATSESTIDSRGALLLRGYFDTRPSRVVYDLDFLPSEDEWKPIKLNVDVKPIDQK
jgi:hypothetical protein